MNGDTMEVAVKLTYGDCEITQFDDTYYAKLGGVIEKSAEQGDASNDPGYAKLLEECNG